MYTVSGQKKFCVVLASVCQAQVMFASPSFVEHASRWEDDLLALDTIPNVST